MDLYQTALNIATVAHKEQIRKHNGSPYVVHPIMVARYLEQAGFKEEVVAAGLVHDVLEDTDFSEADLREALGSEVVEMVLAVSEDKNLVWEERKEKYVESVLSASESVWALSVADKIHNAQDFIEHYAISGPAGWQVFNRGKDKKIWFERLLLSQLQLVWQHPLLDQYAALVDELEKLSD
ncbi:HD domain-containing protein [Candidatus Kaiserbacteria bacterium]|nr:HD domain-containing protein [Candidatus Kaiserbacteria bacterium]